MVKLKYFNWIGVLVLGIGVVFIGARRSPQQMLSTSNPVTLPPQTDNLQVRAEERVEEKQGRSQELSNSSQPLMFQWKMLNVRGNIHAAQGRYREAIKLHNQALNISRKLPGKEQEAMGLSALGGIYLDLGDYFKAIDYLSQGRDISREINSQEGEAVTLHSLGLVYAKQGKYYQALEQFDLALPLARNLPEKPPVFNFGVEELNDFLMQVNRIGESTILNSIGAVNTQLGNYQEALDRLTQALTIAEELSQKAERLVEEAMRRVSTTPFLLPAAERLSNLLIGQARLGEGVILNNFGELYSKIGQYDKAIEALNQGLIISEKTENPLWRGIIFNNIGEVYRLQGKYKQALEDFYEPAWEIFQTNNIQYGAETTLSNMGIVYENLGQYYQALSNFNQALNLSEKIGDRAAPGRFSTNIGGVYYSLGQYDKAEESFNQALKVWQEIGNLVGEGTILNNLGVTNWRQREFTNAEENYQQALKIWQELGDRFSAGRTLTNLGVVYRGLGQYDKAETHYREALAIAREIGDRSGEGIALNNLGSVYTGMGKYSESQAHLQQALTLAEEIGDRPKEGGILSNLGALYEIQGNTAEAIKLYQQAIAVKESILGNIKIEELKTSFVDEQVNVYERLIALLWNRGDFEDAFNYVERVRARVFLDQLNGGRVNLRAGDVSNLLERERELKNQIRARRQQLINLRNLLSTEQDKGVIKEVAELLKVLEKEYADLLTQLKIQNPEVADLVSIDREFFSNSLKTLQGLLDPETTLLEYFVTEERTFAFIVTRNTFKTVEIDIRRDALTKTITAFRNFASLDDPHPDMLQQLYQWLIAPVKPYLKTSTIGIVPHGTLHYLPFAALTDGNQYLSDKHTLINLPSGNLLRFLPEKQKRQPQADTVLALGDPDIREPLSPLKFAVDEVETIAELFGTTAKVGAEATETIVKSQGGRAGILHLAAHGQYNLYNPLFSTVYLADDNENDGRLEVHEVYELNLQSATNLVVLSACNTKTGELSRGDEIVGLNRAFLFAGTPSVMASLWTVNDEATALLMKQFYKYLRRGMGKAEALQQARIDLRSEYPHPYYWAAFVLTGDGGVIK